MLKRVSPGRSRVNPKGDIETFAAVELHIDNWRWQGEFALLSPIGKTGMPKAGSEICIHFRPAPGVLFGANRKLQPNVLVLRVQPREGISLQMNAKTPGNVTRIAPTHMDFNYNDSFGSYSPEAYERLLLDAILGDFRTLFIRMDEVEGSWQSH